MSKKLNPIKVQRKLLEKGIPIFSPLEFRRLFDVTENAASFFINYHLKDDFFIKLKNGLYALKMHPPSELEIANRMYSPSYLSLEYAMMYFSILPDTVYTVTSVTTKQTREFVVNNVSYTYSKIKKSAFKGYLRKSIHDNIVLIAEPEKAFVDYLYFVNLGKKVIYDRLDVSRLSKSKLITYAQLFKRKSLSKLVNKIYDQRRRSKTIIC
ncbi:hypothetical protein MYX06_01995 [Patescibacteria group bacterium AH-259-L05]|nr:hypothetical protein [Patescibacteria group bacterium AH-259-L05]